ncbi:MAG: FAD-dependent oxidoreductase [Anaerolineales bacterium]
MKTTELAVIGAGPGGLSAAVTAAQAGVQVTLLDEYPRPGGQYLRGAHSVEAISAKSKTERRSRSLLEQLPSQNIKVRTGTLVWGIEGHRLALHSSQGTEWLGAKKMIIATGARELVTPFPGWTLPGVMTVGAAQILVKEHGVVPGKRILLAGSGPLLLATASALAKSEHEVSVLGILEATQPQSWMKYAPVVLANLDRVQEGWQYARSLFANKIPYHFGYSVIRVEGTNRLTGATIARVDRQGKPVPGSEQSVPLDTLCIGFGFVPNIELTQLAGCVHEYLPERGGWVPIIDETLETSVPGIYAVGETAGVSGAKTALIQGQIAGAAIARELGKLNNEEFARRYIPLNKQLQPLKRFGSMLNTLFRPPPALNNLITDETIICRCEQIRAGEIRQAIRKGAHTLSDLKNWLPVGQGHCQGRTCGLLLARLIRNEIGMSVGRIDQFRPRPPLKPIPLGALGNLPGEEIQ